MPTFLFESTISPVPPTVSKEEKRLVLDAVVLNKLVVVAEVPVALTKVKFWRVVEPMTKRSPEELMVVVAVPPILIELAVRMLENKLVVVAEVVVELPLTSKLPVILKLESMVLDAVEMKPFKNPRVVEVETPHEVGVQAKVPLPPQALPVLEMRPVIEN